MLRRRSQSSYLTSVEERKKSMGKRKNVNDGVNICIFAFFSNFRLKIFDWKKIICCNNTCYKKCSLFAHLFHSYESPMNISLFLPYLRAKIEQLLTSSQHIQTNNTWLVAVVAICMVFVSFISNREWSMWPLLQANVQNAYANSQTDSVKKTLDGQTIIIDWVRYTLAIAK